MCKSSLHDFLAKIPKAEHHVHIEGTLTPSLLFTLAARNNITLPANDPAYANEASLLERYKHFSSLDDFLGYYYTGSAVLIHQQDFQDLASAHFFKAHHDGVVHAEISFDPQAHLTRGISFSTILDGLLAAKANAESQLKMSVEIICCFLRHMPVQESLDLYDSASFRDAVGAGQIKGIGLDSSETGFPPTLFTELYRRAARDGLRLTAHAGEEGPAENIHASLSILGCERIDHGIRLADDIDLMKHVAKRGILLTVCPLSNVRLRCVEKIEQLPIRRFLEEGVKFSLNSDDGAYFGGFVLDNYCAVQDAFGLEVKDWKRIGLASIEGSWCSEERKNEIKEMLEEILRGLEGGNEVDA